MFSLLADPSKKLITVRMSGFLTVEEVQSISRQEQDAVKAMGCRSGEFLLLVDTDGAVIQSQEVVAAFKNLVSDSPYTAKRIAVVRHDALTRMQTRRILADRNDTAIFETTTEAMAWLLAE